MHNHDPKPDVTLLLQAVRDGQSGSGEALLEAVYHELRVLARSRMQREKAGQTLQATALVHEAWLRLDAQGQGGNQWQDRRHFFGAAARAMRQILVERYRRVNRIKRGGEHQERIDEPDFDAIQSPGRTESLDLVALDDALNQLAKRDPRMAEIVQLRYFAGLSVDETADAMGISPRTVKREWSVAKGFLFQQMN